MDVALLTAALVVALFRILFVRSEKARLTSIVLDLVVLILILAAVLVYTAGGMK